MILHVMLHQHGPNTAGCPVASSLVTLGMSQIFSAQNPSKRPFLVFLVCIQLSIVVPK